MTSASADRILSDWQTRLGLRTWTMQADWVPEQTLEDGSIGECGDWKAYGATVRVALRSGEARATIIHELLHCLSRDTVHRVFESLQDDLGRPAAAMAEKSWLIEEERLVRRLERVILELDEKANA